MSHGHDYDTRRSIKMNILLTQPPQVFELTWSYSMTRQRDKPFREEMSSRRLEEFVDCPAETSGPDPV